MSLLLGGDASGTVFLCFKWSGILLLSLLTGEVPGTDIRNDVCTYLACLLKKRACLPPFSDCHLLPPDGRAASVSITVNEIHTTNTNQNHNTKINAITKSTYKKTCLPGKSLEFFLQSEGSNNNS